MQIYCPTPNAIILVACHDKSRNSYQVILESDLELPSFSFTPKPLLPIAEQIYEITGHKYGASITKSNIKIEFDFCEHLQSGINEASLYLLIIDVVPKNVTLGSIPEMLQKLPKNKNRLAYLKAWQVLMGTHRENIKVISSEDLK